MKSIAATWRQLGWLDGGLYLLSRALLRVSAGRVCLQKYRFIAQPVAAKPWLPAKRGAAIEVREIAFSDPLVREFPRPAAAIPYRFGQGSICLAAFTDGHCAGFLWLVLGTYAEDEVRCRYVPLPEGEASWDFDLYVYPEHRSSLVFLRLWDEANRYLGARGVRWSLSRISAFNPDSMAAHARMGARRIGSAVFLSLGAMQFSAATVAPRLFLSLGSQKVPAFRLDARGNDEARAPADGKSGTVRLHT